jgi:hypothetical protein
VDGLSPEAFDLLARANKARARSRRASSLFFTPDEEIVYTLTKPVKKALLAGETCGYDHLAALAPKLEGLEEWTVEALDALVTAHAEEKRRRQARQGGPDPRGGERRDGQPGDLDAGDPRARVRVAVSDAASTPGRRSSRRAG